MQDVRCQQATDTRSSLSLLKSSRENPVLKVLKWIIFQSVGSEPPPVVRSLPATNAVHHTNTSVNTTTKTDLKQAIFAHTAGKQNLHLPRFDRDNVIPCTH